MDYLSNILSSLLGALIGFFASIYIYRISLLDAATDLDAPRNDVAAFKTTFADIYALFLIYRGTVLMWNRGRLDRAWEIYQGADAKKKHGLEDMLVPSTPDEVQDRPTKFLRAIQ